MTLGLLQEASYGMLYLYVGIFMLLVSGFVEMVIFVVILGVGLAYAWKKGALKWV